MSYRYNMRNTDLINPSGSAGVRCRPARIRAAVVLGATLGLVAVASPAGGQTAVTGSATAEVVPADACVTAAATYFPVAAEEWILVDADTGSVLSCYRHHDAVPPASTVKLLTALIAMERLELGTEIVVSELAASQPSQRIGLVPGERWRYEALLQAMIVGSANDAAYALAEASSGSIDAWADDARELAIRLGLTDSTFIDPAGLDGGATSSGTSRLSAFELAILARSVLARPELAQMVATTETAITGPDGVVHEIRSSNQLFELTEGVLGVKAGYTSAAGHTIVAAATRSGRTMIAVVLGSSDLYGATSTLLEMGFASPIRTPGTGERLPALRVIQPASLPSGAERDATRAAASTADPDPSPTATTLESDPSGGFPVSTPTLIIALTALATLGLLRRRAIVKQRRIRLQRRKFIEAQRKGLVHVCTREAVEDGDTPTVRVHRMSERPSTAAAASPVVGRPMGSSRPPTAARPATSARPMTLPQPGDRQPVARAVPGARAAAPRSASSIPVEPAGGGSGGVAAAAGQPTERRISMRFDGLGDDVRTR